MLCVSWIRYQVMKTALLSLLFIGILFTLVTSCDSERINPAEESFEFYENANLVEEFPYAELGEKLVFRHYYMAADKENIANDEYAEEVYFAVNAGEEFYLEGPELQDIDFVFKQYCDCTTFDKLKIVDGYLKGDKKGNDRYLLEANVELRGYYMHEGEILESQILHSAFTGLFKKGSISAINQR